MTERAITPASGQLLADLRTWVYLRAQYDRLSAQINGLRDRISTEVDLVGWSDENGHRWLELPESFEYAGNRYLGVKRERRVSRTINEERAWKFAADRGLLDRLFPPRPTLDEQELYVLYQQDKITEADIDVLYDTKITWAFKAHSEPL